MANNSLGINIGDQYYDELNDRYLTVETIRDCGYAICKVEELELDQESGEWKMGEYKRIYTMNELEQIIRR